MKNLRLPVAVMAALSVIAWVYRMHAEYWQRGEIPFYLFACLAPVLLLGGALWMATTRRRWAKVLGVVLAIPAAAIWVGSVVIGFYGFRIH